MPVANKQLEELYGVFRKHVSQTALRDVLMELQGTEAYQANNSFAVTVDRLLSYIQPVIEPKTPGLNVPIVTTMVIGHRYKIVHKSGTERNNRRSVMSYMGTDTNGDYVFNARPVAGTQTMPPRWVISIEEVSVNTEIYLNVVQRADR